MESVPLGDIVLVPVVVVELTGASTGPINVTVQLLTYSQYESIGGDLDAEFPDRPPVAADSEFMTV